MTPKESGRVTASRLFANNRARAKRGKKAAARGVRHWQFRHWQLLPKTYSSAENEIRPMPTRNINLTPEQDAFIDEMLKAGEYRNASEAMRDAIGALKRRRAGEALKLNKLRLSIRHGVAALDRGDYTEVEDEDLDAALDDLAAPDRR
jgi:antitoxin ParD1/3/4